MDIEKIILSHSRIERKEIFSSIENVIKKIKDMKLEVHNGEILIYRKDSDMNSFIFKGVKEKTLINAIRNLKEAV
jgi:hypothetical protein